MKKIAIQYLTSQNIQIETNRHFRKLEAPHNQTTQRKHQRKNKNKFRKSKENYKRGKDYLTINKKHRMENRQDGNGKNKSSINLYISKYHNRIE